MSGVAAGPAAPRGTLPVAGAGGGAPPSTVLRATLLALPLLAAGAWTWLLLADGGALAVLLDPRTWERALAFVGALLGGTTPLSPRGPSTSFLDGGRWWELLVLAGETLAMSVLAIALASLGALATVMAGARPHPDARPAGVARRGVFRGVRALWIVARAVPELVWAMLLVLVLRPGPLAGALALAIHDFGIVGKLCSEVVEDLDPRPARALRSAGAGPAQALAYAVLPQALPRFLTFALYRWEVIIRTTIVVGFVSAGGLGRDFRLAMSFFHYSDLTMILAVYFALVLGVDWTAERLRRLAR